MKKVEVEIILFAKTELIFGFWAIFFNYREYICFFSMWYKAIVQTEQHKKIKIKESHDL